MKLTAYIKGIGHKMFVVSKKIICALPWFSLDSVHDSQIIDSISICTSNIASITGSLSRVLYALDCSRWSKIYLSKLIVDEL